MENLKAFEKILIAVDDSKYSFKAADYGFALARKLNAKVALIHINEMPMAMNVTGDPILGDPGMVLPDMMDIQKEQADKLFERLKSEFAKGITVDEYNLVGNITDEIIEIAKTYQASLIVMGTHGRTGIDHFLSGSVAENVSRHAKCPVLIVPNKD
ncbi:MAG: universal stress protein [Pelobium sp.]